LRQATLLRLIAGFEMPSTGGILLEAPGGRAPAALPPAVNTVFQSYGPLRI